MRVLIVVGIACMACLAVQAQPRQVVLDAAQLRACRARRGEAVNVRFHVQACQWPTRDAGQPCTDSAACEGTCDAPWGTAMDARLVGACSAKATDLRGGCLNEVVDGRASGDICVE